MSLMSDQDREDGRIDSISRDGHDGEGDEEEDVEEEESGPYCSKGGVNSCPG